jgi:hypothetical protein
MNMDIRVTITRNGAVLVSEVYPVAKEGDVEAAVIDALKIARLNASGATFDYQISIDKA